MILNFIYPTINADINTYNLTTKMLKLTNYQTKLKPFPVIVGISPFDFTKKVVYLFPYCTICGMGAGVYHMLPTPRSDHN